MRKISAAAVLDRLLPALGLKNDSELARVLGTGASTVSSWRKRDSVPFAICAEFATKHDWSLDWLMFGEGDMSGGVGPGGLAAETPREEGLLTLFRELPEAEQQEIQQAAEEKKRLREVERKLEEVSAQLAGRKAAS